MHQALSSRFSTVQAGVEVVELCASIYDFIEPVNRVPATVRWNELADDASCRYTDKYCFQSTWGYQICLLRETNASPDRAVVRYRTIRAEIRRKSGGSTLLDLSVANIFSNASSLVPEPIQIVDHPAYAKWARNAGQISLAEHMRLIEAFVSDLICAGWRLQPAALTSVRIDPPEVRSGRNRIVQLPSAGFSSLHKDPVRMPDSGLDFGVVWPEAATASQARDRLTEARIGLLGPAATSFPRIKMFRRIQSHAINLVLLEDDKDLNEMPELRDTLRTAEEAGVRFKLAKIGTMGKTYPALNVAYDMFLLGGGKPWLPTREQTDFYAFDAGHDAIKRQSRWVRVQTDAELNITNVMLRDTTLGEHMSDPLLNDLWPQTAGIVCRDGRTSQEKIRLEARADEENRTVIESKKSPKAILWRKTARGISPAEFCDAVTDSHGDFLVQTCAQNAADYLHPVRLTIRGDQPLLAVASFLHQQALPGLSRSHLARLPGALYFADLVSKLTGDGWTKGIGRGFQVPQIVPT